MCIFHYIYFFTETKTNFVFKKNLSDPILSILQGKFHLILMTNAVTFYDKEENA